jgi:hypothetical protein
MQELLLRVEAEQSDAPGRSGVPTVYFRDQKRRLLRRSPRFAVKYLLATRRRRKRSRSRRDVIREERVVDGAQMH